MKLRFSTISVLTATAALAACTWTSKEEVKEPKLAMVEPAASGDTPSIFIAAPMEQVQQVIVSRAASRGSQVKVGGNGRLVLERELPSDTAAVVAACGPSAAHRRVRVVMTLDPQQGGTELSERRFIIDASADGKNICPFPISSTDYSQSMNSMQAVKAEAEK